MLDVLGPVVELDVLIGCEKSRVVADAFEALGHNAWSCDLLPCERPSNKHIQGDIREQLNSGFWDLIVVLHPPCTRLCNSGVRWLHKPPKGRTLEDMWAELDEGAALFSDCLEAKCDHVAVENPVMHKYAKERIRNYRKPAFSRQPWQFGHDEEGEDNEKKRTCFWTKGLPDLEPTGTLDGSTARDSVHKASPGAKRGEERSRFFPGFAEAMAKQWSEHVIEALLADA